MKTEQNKTLGHYSRLLQRVAKATGYTEEQILTLCAIAFIRRVEARQEFLPAPLVTKRLTK